MDLLRHGSCEGGEVYRGSTDLPLDPQGWEQMRKAVKCTDSPWQSVVSSPLQRCRLFSEELVNRMNIPLKIDDGFQELHFGDWEGRTFSEVWQEEHNHVQLFFANPIDNTPPNGESMPSFRNRVMASWRAMLACHRGKHALLVAHGGTIRILLSEILEMPMHKMASLTVPYACLSRVVVYHTEKGDSTHLVFHNKGSIE